MHGLEAVRIGDELDPRDHIVDDPEAEDDPWTATVRPDGVDGAVDEGRCGDTSPACEGVGHRLCATDLGRGPHPHGGPIGPQ